MEIQDEEKCYRCGQVFPFALSEDANQTYCHWNRIDNHNYCSPCFMQLFLDGLIDLTSDRLDFDHDDFVGLEICTSITDLNPYQTRLDELGYKVFGIVSTWNEVKQLCRMVVALGFRYLIFNVPAGDINNKWQFIVYSKYQHDASFSMVTNTSPYVLKDLSMNALQN